MRSNPGNSPDIDEKSADDIPHYLQYHLENPGADVLIAALQPLIQADSGTGADWSETTTPPMLENIGLTTEDSGDGE